MRPLNIVIVIIMLQWCNKKITFPHSSINVSVEVLNKYIKLPNINTVTGVDTIYTLISNNSEFEYVYMMTDSFLFLSDGPIMYDLPLDADPSDGIIVRFLDKDNQFLKINMTSGFTESPIHTPDIKYIKPQSKYLIKTPLKFPHHINEISQQVENIGATKKVAIIFNSFGFQSYNNEQLNKKLKSNQKILKIRNETILPIEFLDKNEH